MMKNYILFFFFAFQVSSYAQHTKSEEINFERKIKVLEINNYNPDEKAQLTNSSCPDNNLIFLCILDDFALKPANITINQSKSLDVSKSICSDYLIFNYNLSTVTDIDSD